MLRRVARVLRVGTLVAGLVLLLSWSVSDVFRPYITLGWPWPRTGLVLADGCLFAVVRDKPPSSGIWNAGALADDEPVPATSQLRPYWVDWSGPKSIFVVVSIPLWLLAFVCLAWPVTSFIIHRRRHKRGFPVEPKGTVNASDPEPRRGA